ncbi:uncharacterized protein FOMMEDRAFT_156687 [Fomitiporia mediterranea MF3/22]|uniref:uncharacterized protein n=1 Tax=Fomitiporia mediterranea (strain MF3/22) TaxID=694068 RepID=UPI0004408045|nr:uncharacterized protein FOMMEDRAFT_156687 [Fomitiporia mediterranea MF3/22]EJD03301.1 hypothetical protein FOMMEDRAFT_156687 [Fomitiporia mediterranea MF3/22]
MFRSDQHALAVAALTALGEDLVGRRGRVVIMPDADTDVAINPHVDVDARGHRRRRSRSRSSRRTRKRRGSVSSRSSTRTNRTLSSCSSTKSLSKASRRSKTAESKAKSTTSKAASAKAMSIGSVASASSRRKTVVTVAPHPKPEKYVPPPRGTFRSSYTRHLRADVIGALVSELEGLHMPESVPLLTEKSAEAGHQQEPGSSSTHSQKEVAIRPPLSLVLTRPNIGLEDLPTLALAEFDFFSASRSRNAQIRETSEVWGRSPAAPSPPGVRRWLKNARQPPIGTVEEVEERSSQNSGEGGRSEADSK